MKIVIPKGAYVPMFQEGLLKGRSGLADPLLAMPSGPAVAAWGCVFS